MKKLRIIGFYFANTTEIKVAVDPLTPSQTSRKSFDEMVKEARSIGWQGDEEDGRGGLVKIQLEGFIRTP